MNIENMRKLRDVIAESKTYDQRRFFHPCGTPACLAGHACMLAGEKAQWSVDRTVIIAEDWLGLSVTEAADAFYAGPMGDDAPTKEDALAMLDRAIETGKVRWK